MESPVHTIREDIKSAEKFFLSIVFIIYGWLITSAKFLPDIDLEAKYNPEALSFTILISIVYGVVFGSIKLNKLLTAYYIPGAYGSYL